MKKHHLKRVSLGLLLLTSLGVANSNRAAEVVTQDILHGYVGVLQGATGFAPAADRPSATASDYAIDFTTSGGGVLITNGSFLNVAAANDVMTFTFWIKKYDMANSSAFWAESPSAGSGNRGFQAHTPWSNNSIYFDTAGCCDAGTQRINAAITSFPGYTDESWWAGWHHWVFFKNASHKEIWIDGQLFLQGENTAPLPTDFTDLWLGNDIPDNGLMHGQMDDFAVFTNVLSTDDISRLANGIAPNALGYTNELLAYWDFNDAPVFGPATGNPLGFTITANDVGANIMDTNNIVLGLNGTSVIPSSIVKTSSVTYVSYLLPNPPFPSGSTQSVSLSIKDKGGNTYNTTSSFIVSVFTTLASNTALPANAVDKNLRGFKIRTVQVDDPSVGNGVQVAEDILSGKYGPNVATPYMQDGSFADTNGYFIWTNVINFDVTIIEANGHFNDPEYTAAPFPGIPGFPIAALPTERFACEFLTALEFTAPGLYTMVVNSDDCFATTSGHNPQDAFSAVALGRFDSTGGRGAADTAFQFFVEQAGLYGFRTVYQQGGGGANIEWFMVNPDGTRVLLNDITNAAIKAYQWMPTKAVAYVQSVIPAINAVGADPDLVSAIIVDGITPVDTNTVSLKIDDAPVAALVTKTEQLTTVTYVPSPLFAAGSQHKAEVSFNDGSTQVSQQWQFTVALFAKDKLHEYWGTLQLAAKYTPDMGGHTGQADDYAIDLGVTGSAGDIYIKNAGAFLNPAATNDEMTFSIWVKKYDNANSSLFWANSPTASGSRGWQAHTPWDNGGTVYFDTAGCCGTDTRINAGISTLPGYTNGFWGDWHLFVFTKKADYKQIWVDGKKLIDGTGASPLPLDFTDMFLGAQSYNVNLMHGLIDDFAIYATALTDSEIALLSSGTAPDALGASTQILAYWDFNDAPRSTVQPTIKIGMIEGKPTITYTGSLQASGTVNGIYTNVVGAASPYLIDTTQASQAYYRTGQ